MTRNFIERLTWTFYGIAGIASFAWIDAARSGETSIVALIAIAVLWSFAIAWHARSREELRTRVHSVSIHHAHPDDGSDYYVALCSRCDWFGKPMTTEAEARSSAYRHSTKVADAVVES